MVDFDLRRDNTGDEEVYSKVVRAGKRTYFFDVKATRGNDYFITITESRKKLAKDGSFAFDKQKIYLYKEDFSKFADGFSEVVSFVKDRNPDFFAQEESHHEDSTSIDDEFDKL